ncbi:MAG: hypothetical protein ACI39H_00785 [Lachnospiraceae bacterium]
MKRMAVLLLTGMLILSTTACGSSKGTGSSASGNTDSTQTAVGDNGEGNTLTAKEENGEQEEDELLPSGESRTDADGEKGDGQTDSVIKTGSTKEKKVSGSTTKKKKTSSNKSNNTQKTSDKKKTDKDEKDKQDTPVIISPSAAKGTMGAKLWSAFKTTLEDDPKISMEELANTLVTNPAIQFKGAAAAVEPGTEYYAGFDEYRITGYDKAAVFMPMIGSIAFIGYVFDLSEDTDASDFVKSLKKNCNPRWNVCVEAEQTAVGAVDDKVFFVMCPSGTD